MTCESERNMDEHRIQGSEYWLWWATFLAHSIDKSFMRTTEAFSDPHSNLKFLDGPCKGLSVLARNLDIILVLPKNPEQNI